MIVLSKSLVLSPPADFQPNNPVIGWKNVVTIDNVSASSSAENFPVSNVANSLTASYWKAASAEGVTIDIELSGDGITDYVGIAGHNFGSAGIAVSVFGILASDGEGEGEGEGETIELVQPFIPANDRPLILRYPKQPLAGIVIALATGSEAARAAVIYAGELLVLQRRIYVGHTPLPFGRSPNVVNGVSESGNFLGSIEIGGSVSSSVSLKNIEPNWYRTNLDPFIEVCRLVPFFFGWRPQDYPHESGFAWITNSPRPVNDMPNGFMAIDFALSGIVK